LSDDCDSGDFEDFDEDDYIIDEWLRTCTEKERESFLMYEAAG